MPAATIGATRTRITYALSRIGWSSVVVVPRSCIVSPEQVTPKKAATFMKIENAESADSEMRLERRARIAGYSGMSTVECSATPHFSSSIRIAVRRDFFAYRSLLFTVASGQSWIFAISDKVSSS